MFKSASLALFALALSARAAINVSTPADTNQCSPISFTASGDTSGPYYAYVMKSDQPCGDPVSQELNADGSGSFKWTPPSAGRFVVVVENSDGTVEGWSNSFNIASTGASSCTSSSSTASHTSTASAAHGTTVLASGARSGSGTSAPANAAQSTGTAGDSQTGAASHTAVGGFTALALLSAVAAALSI